jgi:rhamnosyltransferase
MASGKAIALSGHLESATPVEADSMRPSARAICAVMVTYRPDSELFNRVAKIVPQVGETLIVDNGSLESCVDQIKKIADQLGVRLILNSANEGLARAINQGAQWAASQGYRWILMLDQDTTVAPDMVESLAEIVCSDPDAQRLAIVGSNFRDKVTGRLSTTVARPGEPGATETVTAITSGSLVSLSAFQALGGLRDDFFIDCVDHEYCLRARARGFRVMITYRPLMEHPIGNFTYHRFLGRTVRTTNHAPLRQYFMARNLLIMIREYARKEPRFIYAYSGGYLRATVKLCLFENGRLAKIKGIVRGCVDGVLGRTTLQ